MLNNRVLLAHRDPVVQELAARALMRLGVTLDVVTESDEAVLLIERNAYGVITLQRDDAVLDAVAKSKHRPVVIVTADDGQGLDPSTVSLIVPEPYDAHTLVGVILACVTPGNAPLDGALPDDLTVQ